MVPLDAFRPEEHNQPCPRQHGGVAYGPGHALESAARSERANGGPGDEESTGGREFNLADWSEQLLDMQMIVICSTLEHLEARDATHLAHAGMPSFC